MIISFLSVIYGQNLPFLIDAFLYNANLSVKSPDTAMTRNNEFDTIFGGQVDYFVYQYPLVEGSDATVGAAVSIETSSPAVGRKYGRTSFSVDAAIYGFAIQVYDGNDTITGNGNPCGGLNHLDNDAACSGGTGISSPGLQLDLSSKDYFATEILSQDIPAGGNLIFRVWDNFGHTGYRNYIHPTTVTQPALPLSPYKPLLFFPFSSFSNPNIVWSNIRAFAVEYNSTISSVDLVIGPIQALGSAVVKSSPTPQPVQPNNQVNFKINISPDIYQTNFLSQLLSPIYHNVTIVDTLPSEFIGFNNPSISVVDQNGTNIPVVTTINGNTATFIFSFNNSQLATLSYNGILPSTFNFCSRSVCNNAAVTITTTSGSMSTIKTTSASTCVNLTSTPSITTNYTTCPNTFNNNLQYNASVCNNGNGVATSVNFFHTSSNSLSNCTINFPSATCNGATCTKNLGDLQPGQCVSVPFSYDCSSFSQTCSPLTFSSNTLANETCAKTSSSSSCSFNYVPASTNIVINSTCPQNLTPLNTNTQHQSTVCNSGTGISRNVVFTYVSSGSLKNCTLSIPSGTCNGGNCTKNLGDLNGGQCVNVAIDISCPTYAQTCTNVNFPSTYFATDTCNGQTPVQSCSFNLNPGTPGVTISNTCPQNLTPSNTTTRLSSNVCNNGTGIARNVIYSYTPSGALVNCTATLASGSCNGAGCTRNLGDLSVNQCVNVVVGINCPTYAQTCTNVNFPLVVSATEGCGTPVTSQSCSFNLNPGTPLVTISQNCPSRFLLNDTVGSITSQVCNNGTGIARNVVYTYNAQNSLTSCTIDLVGGTCNAGVCTKNLGDIAAGSCLSQTINYNCNTFSQTCSLRQFASSFAAVEGCGTAVQPKTCNWDLNPGLASLNSTSPVCPPSLTENSTTISYTARICNQGTGFARGVVFQQDATDSLSQCIPIFPTGTCNGNRCTKTIGILSPGECQNVDISYDCSTFAKTCVPLHFNANYSATETCANSTTVNSHCTVVFGPGISNITTSFVSCPTFDNNLRATSISQVCNIGTGIARNVVFTHNLANTLTQCTPSISLGTCSGSTCTANLGDMLVGQCRNITVDYNCGLFIGDCLVHPFSADSSVTETCGSSNQQSTCTFSTNPSLTISVNETLLNTVPAKTNQVITWNITGTNLGTSTSKAFSIFKTYPNFTAPTSQTLSVWSCGANNVCSFNGSSLLSGQSVNLQFAVTVLPSIPLSTTQVCNNVLMVTLPNQANCFSQATTNNCAPVDPNVPDLVLKKSVVTTQYTFKIKYTNIGTGPVNNLQLKENLQPGWSLNSNAASAGWSCSGNSCSQTIPNVPFVAGANSGTSLFIVDVNPLFQTLNNGSSQCWVNLVNSTFDDVQFDKTPENNFAYSPPIGSYCQHCCDPVPCPPANCTQTCPPTQLIINCPPVACKCDIPEQWCPTCKKINPPCDCNQCNNNGVIYA